MRVYKFYPAKWGIESLKKERLKVSPVNELNDPFEYLALDLGEKTVREWAGRFRNEVSGSNGIISFSSSWQQPLLWAHYADAHRGMALGFDVPDRLLFQIDYIDARINPGRDIDHNKEERLKLINKMLRSKHKEWAYESEYRLLRPLEVCEKEGDNFFAAFNDETQLKEVILGCRYKTLNLKEMMSRLRNRNVKFLTARPKFKGFEMTRQLCSTLEKQL